MKKTTVIFILALTFVLFQNFRSVTFDDSKAIAIHIDPNDFSINEGGTEIVHSNRVNSDHEVVTQLQYKDESEERNSDHLNPVIAHNKRLSEDVLLFEAKLEKGIKRTRSEIRVKDVDSVYSDESSDPIHYAKFEIYLPHDSADSSLNNMPKDNKTWNIIWQVAQIGADESNGFWRNNSPPISLQLYDRRLYAKYSHDYKRTRHCDKERWVRFPAKNIPDYNELDEVCVDAGVNISEMTEAEKETELKTVKYRYEVSPDYSTNYVGYVKKNAWNKIFVAYKLGKEGMLVVFFNGKRIVSKYNIPLGYQLAAEPEKHLGELSPKYLSEDGHWKFRKRASARFGLYQGHKYGNIPEHNTRIYFKYYSGGTNWSEVRWALDEVKN